MTKVFGPSAFLNQFGVRNERVKILYWLERHGGAMTLSDVMSASREPDEVVMHKVVGFLNDGFVRCDFDLNVEELGEMSEFSALKPQRLELTEQGRALLKYA